LRIAYLLESTGLSGGAKVAFQQAEELARRRHAVTVVSPEERPRWFPLSRAAFERAEFSRSEALAGSEIAVATFWTTVAPAVTSAGGAVFHLCQGYEAAFEAYASRRDEILAAYALPARKLVIAPHLRETLLRAGHGESEVVGQTFEAGEFAVAARPPRETLTILLPGIDVGDVKGVREALRSLAGLRRRGVKFRLARVSAEPVSRWEASLGVTDEYHREVPPPRMRFLYASADIFLGPSRIEDGFDLPALEALASSLPAAVSDTPAHRHALGDAAVYFAPKDERAIAEAVEGLLSDEATRRRLSALGPDRAGRFRTSEVADRLEAIFTAALAERRSAPVSHA